MSKVSHPLWRRRAASDLRKRDNDRIARRRPTLRFQLALLGTGLAALVALGLYADRNDSTRPSPVPTTSLPPTSEPGFPPAPEGSPCRDLVSTAEAERLVGASLEFPVIEPIAGNCAWPTERGNPRDAALFLILEARQEGALADHLERDFAGITHRLEPAPGVGDEALFVLRHADVEGRTGDEFVEGLHVYAGAWRVVLANGGRDIWPGSDDAVRERLAALLARVVARLEARVDRLEG